MIAFDTETTSVDSITADLVGVSLAVSGGRACYIPLAHRALDQPILQPEMAIALTEMVQRHTRRLYLDKIQLR